jgi:predicted DNA-binding transcriptional regulator YafY
VLRLRRSNATSGSVRPVYTAPRTAPPEADVDAQLAVLRGGRPAADAAGGHPAALGSEEATQLGLETLLKAIRLKQRVVMNVVDSLGNAVRETVVPVAVNGGRVRVFDPEKDTERVLSIHRIIDVEAAEELLQ